MSIVFVNKNKYQNDFIAKHGRGVGVLYKYAFAETELLLEHK